MEYIDYQKYMLAREREWESSCRRCGSCCGAYEDPCQHLDQDETGLYFCAIYENRFGIHKSEKGQEFKCVPIRDVLHKSWKNDYLCVYKEELKCPIKRLFR